MSGAAGINLELALEGKQVEFGIPADAHSRWELRGRRPLTGIPVPVHSENARGADAQAQRPRRSNNPTSAKSLPDIEKQLSELYFRGSWRESARDNEAYIIATAEARAEQYLGEHRNDVISHLPEVKHSQHYPSLSTSHIRHYVGVEAEKARLPFFMISTKLSEATDLDGEAWQVKVWEILRCE